MSTGQSHNALPATDSDTQTLKLSYSKCIYSTHFFYIYIKCNFISDIKQNNIGLRDMH